MVVNDLLSVIHAAVTDFDCVTIKDSFKFVVFREVLVFYGNESVSDIGADNFAEWGVVPEYVVLLSVFSFVSCGWLVMCSGQVSTFFECFSIWNRPSTSKSTQ